MPNIAKKPSKAAQVARLRVARAAKKGSDEPGKKAAKKNARLPAAPKASPAPKQSGADRPPSKSAIVHKMLTSSNGATRKELSEATGWPSVNLTVAAARAGMKLEEDTATGKCRLVAKA